jgi:2-amino-4-hydroxy-6-hydroxymethyldihydropteridine diphosphokinase
MSVSRAYVGLGSNLGDREATLRRALELLAEDGIEVVAISTFRETDPVGYLDQPRFLNGAAAVETSLGPRELLDRLLAVERALGRTRGEGPRYGPRTIDLDLLLYDEEDRDEPGLEIPHPRLHERRFALEPLAELAPDAVVPGRGRVSALLSELESVS